MDGILIQKNNDQGEREPQIHLLERVFGIDSEMSHYEIQLREYLFPILSSESPMWRTLFLQYHLGLRSAHDESSNPIFAMNYKNAEDKINSIYPNLKYEKLGTSPFYEGMRNSAKKILSTMTGSKFISEFLEINTNISLDQFLPNLLINNLYKSEFTRLIFRGTVQSNYIINRYDENVIRNNFSLPMHCLMFFAFKNVGFRSTKAPRDFALNTYLKSIIHGIGRMVSAKDSNVHRNTGSNYFHAINDLLEGTFALNFGAGKLMLNPNMHSMKMDKLVSLITIENPPQDFLEITGTNEMHFVAMKQMLEEHFRNSLGRKTVNNGNIIES